MTLAGSVVRLLDVAVSILYDVLNMFRKFAVIL